MARGGGAFEDLIGFSDENVVRAAAAAHTPLISAIGHEDDWTLLDLVADLRASTPTDAAKKVVPDVHEQMQLIQVNLDRMRVRIDATVSDETEAYRRLREPSKPHPAAHHVGTASAFP